MAELDYWFIAEHRVALINPLQVDESLWTDLPTRPVVPSLFKTQPHLFPLLVDLHELDSDTQLTLLERFEQYTQISDAPFLSALIASNAPLAAIHRQLVRCFHARRKGVDRMVRLHDPLVFRHLRWLLNQQQLDRLLGVVETWSWPEGSGAWTHLSRQSDDAAWFRWPDKQWQTLSRIRDINRCLREATRLMPELDSDDTALAQRIDALLIEADDKQGLVTPDDRVLYVLQAIRFHSRIHEHRAIRKRLNQARAGERSYVSLCSDLDDASMQELAYELDTVAEDI